ncbi:hypothetical protein OGM63_14520 [Plectonema radiosum NIES-515]|jgi:hypothetical protein|uniref:Uncharacterized protein n=1 Tax=Plectonema radiosum NIES-515 TaxID=2986073 RepID=A0ABT3B009_9CYAN|nr:hypothetical protein [Plectonema radiosum]MCV3214715.1 hypothetical protein [Plectonema radiosum NIES-515]
MADSDQLNIRVEEQIKKDFIHKAREEGTTATDLLVNYMKQYLGLSTKKDVELVKLEQKFEKELKERDERLIKLEQIVLGELPV